jgi:hypothetical protein
MGMRNRTRCLLVAGVLLLGTAACGDKTVTSQPAATTAPAGGSIGATGSSADVTATDDADLQVVDQILRDVDGDITATNQDRATPEGDPTE